MDDKIKKLLVMRTVFWILSSIVFSVVIYALSGSIAAALIVGFAFFLYSLSAIYIYYQYIKNERKRGWLYMLSN